MTDARTQAIRGRAPCLTCQIATGIGGGQRRSLERRVGVGAENAESKGGEDDAPCPCVVTVDIMRELGMSNAAKMHDQTAGEGGGGPGVHDVELHMGDEESRLFPVLRRVADRLDAGRGGPAAAKLRRDVATLEYQHGQYRSQWLAKGLVPPPNVLGPHGHAEDKIVSEYADMIRAEWENMRAAKIAGIVL